MSLLRAIFAVYATFTGAALADCENNRVLLTGDWGSVSFSVEIADDDEERAQGLMFRERLPASSGMLFVYEEPHDLSFWMRNTLIPLDMIFLDTEGRVVRVHENAIPGDETPIRAGAPAVSVLEINGGLARRIGIDADTVAQHPAFGPNAALPCK